MAERTVIEVQSPAGMHAAVLRYFDSAGSFAATAAAALGAPLPAPLRAVAVTLPGAAGGESILAWSRPGETLLLTASGADLSALTGRLASVDGGQILNITGALVVLRLTGAHTTDLIARLGSAHVPQPGEARRGRLADVPVLSLCVRAGETWLLVDRAYARHLTGWIDATLADRAAGGSATG